MGVDEVAEIIERVRAWPKPARRELLTVIGEMEADLTGGAYEASEDELAGIDRGLHAAENGRFASESEVAAILRSHRER